MHGKILIVEDDQDICDALKESLELLKLNVIITNNGKEALSWLENNEPPCLILLDLMMPVMDGTQFRDHQLANPYLADIPIVVVSADNNAANKAARMGAEQSLAKPINFKSLVEITQKYCGIPG